MARPCHFPPLGHPRMVQASLGQVAKEFSSRFPSSLSCVCHVIYVDTCRHKISWIIVLFLVVKSWTPWLVCPDVFLVLVRTDDQLFINIVLFANLFQFSARYSSVAFTIVGCNFSHVSVLVFVDLQSIYSTVAVRRNAGSANSVPGFCFCQVSNLAHSWCADVYIHVYPVFAPKNVPHPESLQCSSGIFCFSSRSCFVLRNAWHKPVKTIAIFGSFDQVCMLTVRWWQERCLKDNKNQNLPQLSKPLSLHVFVM